MALRYLFTPLFLVLCFVPACSDSDGDADGSGGGGGAGGDTGGAGGNGAGESCPLVALSCPDGCDPIDATILNEMGDNCASRTVRLGCWDPAEDATDDMACVKDASSGALHRVPSGTQAAALAETDDYEACSDAETTMAIDAQECVNTFGADGGTCPLTRGACPDGCEPFMGRIYDGANECLEPETQLGCYSVDGVITKNGGCVKDATTDDVWLVSSGAYAQQLLVSGDYVACGLDDTAGSGGAASDCP